MRKSLQCIAATAALLILGIATAAQAQDWYAQREERFREERWRAHLFSEVRTDLDHVQSVTFSGRDEYRIVRTKEELNDLQADLAAHRFDSAKLDDVIGGLQRVVDDNRMSGRDRDILNDDLQRLKDYQAHHENWGQ